jgi:hypothetical protein
VAVVVAVEEVVGIITILVKVITQVAMIVGTAAAAVVVVVVVIAVSLNKYKQNL